MTPCQLSFSNKFSNTGSELENEQNQKYGRKFEETSKCGEFQRINPAIRLTVRSFTQDPRHQHLKDESDHSWRLAKEQNIPSKHLRMPLTVFGKKVVSFTYQPVDSLKLDFTGDKFQWQ